MAGAAYAQEVQGVTDTEILIGSNGDLSGVFAAFNVQAIKAAQLYFDEVNAKGGVHGRTIRFIVEDHQYQIPKAQQNFNKLVNSDKVFAMVLNLGTPHNIAGFQMMEPKKIANISPLSAGRQMIEGDITYKYTGSSSYYDQLRAGIRHLAKDKGATKICAMYFPQDYGKEVEEGTKEETAALGLEFAAETVHRPDEQEFVGSVTKLREAGCQVIAIGLTPGQIPRVIGTAKQLGWTDVSFIGCSAGFHTVLSKVPGGVMEGYYAAAGWSDLEARMDNPELKAWAESFQAKYSEPPATAAQLGRSAAGTLVAGLEAAGKDLTPESFQKGMESLSFHDSIMDIDVKYGPGDHQGADGVIISQINGGKWGEVARVDPAKSQ
ncbi:MAG: ABC transporter substrate-binding protein [Rhizobiaceae bacterium]|nr:ABC transporter substrate-binding protein [Rhizobiaceae bacterium]